MSNKVAKHHLPRLEELKRMIELINPDYVFGNDFHDDKTRQKDEDLIKNNTLKFNNPKNNFNKKIDNPEIFVSMCNTPVMSIEEKNEKKNMARTKKEKKTQKRTNQQNIQANNVSNLSQSMPQHIRMNQWLNSITVNLQPKTEMQTHLICMLNDESKPVVIVSGPAGTGKTLLSTTFAIKKFIEGKYKKIIICRPNVAVDDRDIGFLPGDINEKMAPWTKPFEDIFLEYFKKTEYEKLLKEGYIEIVPLAYIRGRTFKNSFVIIDEAQGTTPNSLLAILTRIGHGSKYVVTGDVFQSDFKHSNGLNDLIKKIKGFGKLEYISLVEFSSKDIQRHPAISEILELYEEEFIPRNINGHYAHDDFIRDEITDDVESYQTGKKIKTNSNGNGNGIRNLSKIRINEDSINSGFDDFGMPDFMR